MSVASAARPRIVSSWQSFEAWVGTRASAGALFALALAVFGIESAFLPAYPGRDMARYLEAFVQLGYHVPVYPAVLNTRGPFAALGVGVPLEIGGWAAEVWLALLYAFSVVAWSRVALIFGARAAVATSVLLLVSPGYAILFHQLASDSLFAAVFAAWALLLSRAILKPSLKAFAIVGVAAGALVLVRPGNQVLLVLAVVPLFLRAPWRDRLAWASGSFIASIVVSQSWHVYATWRWGSGVVALKPSTGLVALAAVFVPLLLRPPWRLRVGLAVGLLLVAVVAARGWPTKSPTQYVRSVEANWSNQFLYRSFELDRIIRPQNGPASQRLAQTVRRDLLNREPYRSYGVHVGEFFASGSDRVFGDLLGVASPADLAAATREAIRRHPGTFARSIGQTIWQEVALRPVYAPLPAAGGGGAAQASTTTSTPQTQYVVVNGHRLPKPSEGQPIPSSAIGPMYYTPGGQAYEAWHSATLHETVVTDAHDRARIAKFNADSARLAARVPTRTGDTGLVHRLNQASHVFPPAIVWLLIGLAAFVWRRPRNALIALAPTAAGLIVIVASSLVAPSVAEYGAPVNPAFILLAAAGAFGVPVRSRRSVSESWRRRLRRVAPLAGAAAGVAAALWTMKLVYDYFKAYANGAGAPNDLAVFLGGAGRVVHSASPYVYDGDKTFAYPPFLAYLIAPLHPLSGAAAGVVWTIVSLAAIAAALWLLELRDWRCYALVGVFMFSRSSIELGTIEPLLLLAVAAAWRWRQRVLEPALAVGVAIVLKLFLWPLAVWLALMRRFRSAIGAAAAAVVLAAVTWAAIGFAGLGHYPGLLRRLADAESTSSYSVVALGVRAHLPLVAARILSVLVSLALLAAAAWTARDERRTLRERDVATLTLTLAAALALSPIVWVHYFLLLLVPLALARPRLSWLWFVPLAYQPLGISTWPAGDAKKLAIALVATLVILGAAVLPWPRRRFAALPPGTQPQPGSRTEKPPRQGASITRAPGGTASSRSK